MVFGDWFLIGEVYVLGEVDLGVLVDFGDEGVDGWYVFGFGVDVGEMCFG